MSLIRFLIYMTFSFQDLWMDFWYGRNLFLNLSCRLNDIGRDFCEELMFVSVCMAPGWDPESCFNFGDFVCRFDWRVIKNYLSMIKSFTKSKAVVSTDDETMTSNGIIDYSQTLYSYGILKEKRTLTYRSIVNWVFQWPSVIIVEKYLKQPHVHVISMLYGVDSYFPWLPSNL